MRLFFLACSMAAGISLNHAACAEEAAHTALPPINQPAIRTEQTDTQRLAQGFVESINAARVALALNEVQEARSSILQAQNVLKAMTSPNYRQLRSARIGASGDADSKPYYFPIEVDAGPVAVKKMETGPIWQRNGIAVTDAEIVYLTLDLKDQTAASALQKAADAVEAKDLKTAQSVLGKLTDDTIRVETAVTVPVEKARDNIFLTREFIRARNYDGARYALSHAGDALDSMEKDARYATRKGVLSEMRKEVRQLQTTIEKRDPSLLTKADASLTHWWQEMKDWRQ